MVYVGDFKWIVERGSCSNYGMDGLIGKIERLLFEGFHFIMIIMIIMIYLGRRLRFGLWV